MKNLSLLYPEGKGPDYEILADNTCSDLSIDCILDAVAENDIEKKIIKDIMIKLESDAEVIRYRGDIFEDIVRFPVLREKMKDMLEQLSYLKTFERSYNDDSIAPVWQLVKRLKELEAYIDCITGIYQALTENPIKSKGLKKLREFVCSVYEGNGFDRFKADISDLLTETSKIRSITLGVNLDESLRPSEVGILSINDESFDHTGILDNFLGFCSRFTDIISTTTSGFTKIHSTGTFAEDDPLMKNLSRAVTNMLGTTVKQLKSKLSRYINISGYSLTKFIPEFTFYIRWADFCSKVMELGLPMSRPRVLDSLSKTLNSKGIYNIKLAMQMLEGKKLDIVRNNFEFSREHGIYIMTGPNRGGKTTFTQAVGMLFLMAQHGLYVPAEQMSFEPCDNILTHFPADEEKTVNMGRLGEESKRLSEIFTSASDKSLLLFNEPLASTSFTEGLYIARDVVQALRFLGARTIFNTHMHELAMHPEIMNSNEGDIKVASLVTGMYEGKRSYKVFIAPPDGVSYARDIAEKYGVTLSQLKDSIISSGKTYYRCAEKNCG